MISDETSEKNRRFAYVALLAFVVAIVGFATVAVMSPPGYLMKREYETDVDESYYNGLDVDQLMSDSLSREGKKHKKKKKSAELQCNDGYYSKRTLQRAYELPFSALFNDNKGQIKYEASSVIIVNHNVYSVCDSSWAISKFGDDLQPFSPRNIQIGDPNREEEDSGYEALFHDGDIFYVVRESVDLAVSDEERRRLKKSTSVKPSSYHAIIEELNMEETDYDVVDSCPSEYEFEGDSKGFEGAIPIHDLEGALVVLGLCEGNYCSESRKDETGNGRLVAMKKTVAEDGSCQWSTLREINIPPTANFRDYSAITLDSKNGRVAITSQEESQVWIGSFVGRDEETGLWNVDALEFDTADYKLYDFPKNDNCETVYCNIEGIHWMNDNMLLAVSDKMKSRGKQDFRCFEKDQSVHAFVIP